MKRIGLVALALMLAVAMSLGAVAAAPAPAAASVPWGQAVVAAGAITTTADVTPDFFQGSVQGTFMVKAIGCDGPLNVNLKVKIMDLDPTDPYTWVGTAAITGYVTTDPATQLGSLTFWGSISMLAPGTVYDGLTVYAVEPSILTIKPKVEGYLLLSVNPTATAADLIWEVEEITPVSGTATLVAKAMMLVNGILDNFVVNVNLGDAIHPMWVPEGGLSSLGRTVVNGVAGMVGDAVDMLAGLVGLLAAPASAP